MLTKKSKKNCCDCQVKTKRKRSKRRNDGSKRVMVYTVHTGRYTPNVNKENFLKSPKKSPMKKSVKKSPKKSNKPKKNIIYGLGPHEMSLMR